MKKSCYKQRDYRLKASSMMQVAVVLLLCFIMSHAAFAQSQDANQPREIKGTVTDALTKEPLPGVTVLLKGTRTMVISGDDGRYALTVPAGNQVLVFSFIGFITQESMVGDRAILDVEMREDTKMLDEVVVVGYGTQKKSDVTGAIATLSRERLENMPSASVSQLLQGAVAGLNFSVNNASANPDGDNIILIRGRNSIAASNDPLLIVDGVPFNGSLGEIAQGDIQSLSILKDASSTAIYGSRASNGVILINTKQGKEGKLTVKYEGYYSLQFISNFPRVMNVDEYITYQNIRRGGGEIDPDDPETWPGLSDYEKETAYMMNAGLYPKYYWSDLILRTGNSQRHQVSVSGGSDMTKFNVSAYMINTKGVVQRDDFQRYNLRANLTLSLAKWLSFKTNNVVDYSDESGVYPRFQDAFNKSPLLRPWNWEFPDDYSVNIMPAGPGSPNVLNPLTSMLWDDSSLQYTGTTTNSLEANFGFLEGLSYELIFNGQFRMNDKAQYVPLAARGEGRSDVSNRIRTTLLIENIAKFNRVFDEKHAVNLTAMYSWEEKADKTNGVISTGFANDFLSWYGANQSVSSLPYNPYNKTNVLSYMFRGSYSYDSRYGAIYTVRHDGASVFGKDTKWGTFMSGGVHWNMHNEAFFKNSFLAPIVNELKLRLTYGSNGNMAINPYQTIAQMDNSYPFGSNETSDYVDGGAPAPGFLPSTLGTPDLSWETTDALNFGFDFGLLNNRINGDFNIYHNITRDLLLLRTISGVHGNTSIWQNVGKTQNQGVELVINSVNISADNFTWSSNFTFSYNRNKILELPDGDDTANRWFVGQPIRVNYDYYISGIWQEHEAGLASLFGAQPGYAKYDKRGDNPIQEGYNDGDRQIIGSPEASTLFGLTNTFNYQNFSLSFFLYAALGGVKHNFLYDTNNNNGVYRDWWTPENPTNKMWSTDNQANAYVTGSNNRPRKYEKTDFLRVKDLTLSYTIPTQYIGKIGLSNLNVYVSVRNLWTITGFGGMDPELSGDRDRAVPLNRELMFGLKLSF
ncbi:MAG: TonB-dependent receptor [Bacteroidales bacterium]|nr:TonB-dependent receptor [Bacteroidales bacterium]